MCLFSRLRLGNECAALCVVHPVHFPPVADGPLLICLAVVIGIVEIRSKKEGRKRAGKGESDKKKDVINPVVIAVLPLFLFRQAVGNKSSYTSWCMREREKDTGKREKEEGRSKEEEEKK